MIEQDTIKLLRECDAGVKMGIASINDVLPDVTDDKLKEALDDSKKEHLELDREINSLLLKYKDEGKDPNPVASGMSWIKTNVMLTLNDSDSTIADLMTDGCNMGIKSLNRYLNEYAAADEVSKDITKRLIKIEEKLSDQVRKFL